MFAAGYHSPGIHGQADAVSHKDAIGLMQVLSVNGEALANS